MCTIGHSVGSACGTTHTYTGFATFRADALALMTLEQQRAAIAHLGQLVQPQRHGRDEAHARAAQQLDERRVRSSARFSSVAGLRARNASSPTIDAGKSHAARQANCSPLV
jgi:hypothetical protein